MHFPRTFSREKAIKKDAAISNSGATRRDNTSWKGIKLHPFCSSITPSYELQ